MSFVKIPNFLKVFQNIAASIWIFVIVIDRKNMINIESDNQAGW